MSSITGKINIDFQVLKTNDPKVLLIADTSDWKHIEDKTSVINIIMPGGKIASEKYFKKRSVNIFNSSILGFTPKACSVDELKDLPDGIYTIELLGSPSTFNKKRYYLKTDRLQLEVDSLYVSLGITLDASNKGKRDLLYNVDLLIKAAEASTRLGDISKASMYFSEAREMLDYYKNCQGIS